LVDTERAFRHENVQGGFVAREDGVALCIVFSTGELPPESR